MGGVPQYSILTLAITGETGIANNTADSVLQAVSADLSSDGRITVIGSPQISTSITDAIFGTIVSLSYSQPFQVIMQIQVNTEFAQASDALSIVEHFFEQESGSYPISASVTAVQTPGASQATPTGLPGLSPGGVGGEGPGSSIADTISNFFSQLTSAAKTLLIALVAIIILVLVLVAYGPNVSKVATAVA